MNGSSHGRAEIGWAASDHTKDGITHEDSGVTSDLLKALFDGRDSSRESLKHSFDVATLLHGDDAEVVPLTDPHNELLGMAVEDAPAMWPVHVVA